MRRGDLLDAVNLVHLVAYLCGPDAVRGLNPQRGGACRDPRPGHEERNASFSVYRLGNRWRWKRHGGDDKGGNALDFVQEVLGGHEAEAWDVLARFQGVALGGWGDTFSPHQKRPTDPLQEARWTLEKCSPLTPEELGKVAKLLAPLTPTSAAAHDLKRRGLLGWSGLRMGVLRHDWRTHEGKLLARAGGLAVFMTGPDGQVWGLKVRNLGTAEELDALGLARYVYRVARHGAPAWCSPGYGSGEAVLLVEGELNAAAAARALEGQPIDVQGLAGAGGTPFLHGLPGKVVYLYADPDEAGQACLARVGRIAQDAGAREVRVLGFGAERDFCDLLGQNGLTAFRTHLTRLLSGADLWQKVFCGKTSLPQNNTVSDNKKDLWQCGSGDTRDPQGRQGDNWGSPSNPWGTSANPWGTTKGGW